MKTKQTKTNKLTELKMFDFKIHSTKKYVCRVHTKRQVNMVITAVCVIFLIKLRWPKNKSIYVSFIFSDDTSQILMDYAFKQITTDK